MRNAGDRAAPGGRPHGAPRDADAGGRGTGSSGRPWDADEQARSAGSASLFTPAYRVSRASEGGQPGTASAGQAGDGGHGRHGHGGYGTGPGGPAWPDDEIASPYTWSTDDPDAWPGGGLPAQDAGAQPVLSNAVRGFPPAPGDSLPVYPPGPFAAWNRGQPGFQDDRDGRASRAGGLADSSQLATATITPDEFDTDYSLPAIKDPIPGQENRSAGPERRRAALANRTEPVQKVRADQLTPAAGRRPGDTGAKGRSGRPAGRGRKKRQPAWHAITAACVIIAAVAGILVVTIPRGTSPPQRHHPSSTPTPVTSSPARPSGQWGYIGSRKTDQVPLTAAELYPATVSSHGTVYTKARQTKGTKCRAALIGSALQAAVKRGACIQTLRATYLSKAAKVMATIGVFNLKTAAAATKAASMAGHAEFVAQLAAKSGPAKAIGQGTGIEEAIVKGHYLVLVWAEKTNLNPPKSKAGRAKLTAFMNLLVNHTVNVSLSNRMVDGKPVPPG